MGDVDIMTEDIDCYKFAAYLCDYNYSEVSDEDISDELMNRFGFDVPTLEYVISELGEYLDTFAEQTKDETTGGD